MKTERFTLDTIEKPITFYIGQNAKDNFAVIDKGESDDLWFHASEVSSCHVVAILSYPYSSDERNQIIKQGANLCKIHTNKISNISRPIAILYTEIKNIQKTKTLGMVITKNTQTIYA